MKLLNKWILLFASFLLSACSAFVPEPTPTPTATATFTPSPSAMFTPVPTETVTQTPSPEPTIAPPATQDVVSALMPVGEPVEEWNGIPIMPGAIAGEEGERRSYRFTVQASREEIQRFYDIALSEMGYVPYAEGRDQDGTLMMLTYDKEISAIMFTLIDVGNGLLLVILEK